jgi:MSHA pilin protein MshD
MSWVPMLLRRLVLSLRNPTDLATQLPAKPSSTAIPVQPSLGFAALSANLPVRCLAQSGMTLVELVLTIVIVGIASAALFSAMAAITGRSADPMLRQQSLAIAEAYMEEITLQAFSDPDGLADCGRSCFDDVGDYHDLEEAPHDARDNEITGMSSYRVQVAVSAQTIGPSPGIAALRILVTVTDPSGQGLVLTGFRASY